MATKKREVLPGFKKGGRRPNVDRRLADTLSAGLLAVGRPADAQYYSIGQGNFDGQVEIAGPGFINVHLNAAFIAQRVNDVFSNGLVPPKPHRTQRIVVDFSSPNIAKEMHVGHLRSTIIGDCICRLLEWLGHDVLRINHVGDWGTQFGMLIAHLEDQGLSEIPAVSDLQALYKISKKRFDEDVEFNKRARTRVVALQNHDPAVIEVWKAICKSSRKEFQRIYDRLDVKLVERGESFYQDRMQAVVDELTKNGHLIQEEGRWLMWAKGQKVPLTVVKSDGGFTYDTSDMAALKQRFQEEKADWCIYVVDAGQATHLETCFAAALDAGYYNLTDKRVDHVAFGMVLGEGKKKMKTREGESLRLATLLDEGLSRSQAKLEEKGRKEVLSPEEFNQAQTNVAYGCIKYADLSHNRINDYVFSFDRMLDDRGNTAAYLLYAYTRIRSIARTAGVDRSTILEHRADLTLGHAKERKLAKTILRFWDVIPQVAEELYPHVLCDFLYELACVFTEFYDTCYCVEKNAEGEVAKINYDRLLLAETTADVMAACFQILGIRTVEKM